MRCHTLYQSEDAVWRLFYPDPADPADAQAPGGANLAALTAAGGTVLFDPGAAGNFGAALAALTGETALESVAAVVITRAGLETCSALPLWRRVCPQPLRVFAPARALDIIAAHDPDAAPEALPGEGAFTPVKGAELNIIPAALLPSADAVSIHDAESGVLYTAAIGAGGWDDNARQTAPFAENFTRRADAAAAHHARTMPLAAARKIWTAHTQRLEVRFMVPERGPALRAAAAGRFFDWFQNTAPETGPVPATAPARARARAQQTESETASDWSAAEAAAHTGPHGAHDNLRGAVLSASTQNPDFGAEREAQLDAALDAALGAAAVKNAARPHADGEASASASAPGHSAEAENTESARALDDAAVLEAALGRRSGELEKLDDAVDKAIEDAAVMEASDAADGAANPALSAEDLDEALDNLIDEAIYMQAEAPEGAAGAEGAPDALDASDMPDLAAPVAESAAESADGPEPEGPETGARFRLITRSDFDGVASAVLLEEMGLIREITFVHPKDMQDGLIPVTPADITANMPYVPGVHMAFDHHASEAGRLGGGADNYINDPDAPSTARVIYEFFGGRRAFAGVSPKMLEAADKADSGRFTMDEVLDPKDWDLLHFIIDARTGLGRFREFRVPHYEMMMDLIDACRDGGIDGILNTPDVKERVNLYMRHRGPFEEQLKRCTEVKDGLAVLDLRGEDTIFAGNRFLIYALFPQCRVSMHVMWGPGRRNVVFACGKSIFDRSAKIDIGALMLEYGGGGHAAAGTCQIGLAAAERALGELTERIVKEG